MEQFDSTLSSVIDSSGCFSSNHQIHWLAMTLDGKTVNTEFNIGAKVFTTMKEDYQAVLDRAGHGKKIRGMPVAPLVFILRILEKLHLSPLYPWVYETASTDSYVSIARAEKLLGFAPKFSNKQALVRNYDWYVAHLAEFAGKTYMEIGRASCRERV